MIAHSSARFIVAQAQLGSTCYGTNVTDKIYGPYAKHARAAIMAHLAGKPVPVSKCGHAACRAAIAAAVGVPLDAGCSAVVDRWIDCAVKDAAS